VDLVILAIIGDWRTHALRGAAAILFGIFTLAWPTLTLLALVWLYGIFALVDGLSVLPAAFRRDEERSQRLSFVFHALLSIAAGVIALVWPDITALALLFVIAFWAILVGGMEVAAAIRLRKEITREWLVALMGVLSIAFGVSLLVAPVSGALAITWLIGWFAMLVGVLRLVFAWRLHSFEVRVEQPRRQHTTRPAAA
jgi:uncharacterized membrane protein HdeD (DUF308 family)